MKQLITHGIPRWMFYFGGGIGDDLLLTTAFRELRKRKQRGIWMMSRYPELYENNPDLSKVVPEDMRFLTMTNILHGKAVIPHYASPVPERDAIEPPKSHIISDMLHVVGIKGEIVLRPYYILSKNENRTGQIGERQIAVQSSAAGARFRTKTKEWIPERFQEVVDSIAKTHSVIQLGTKEDPLLDNVIDLRGRTSIRETASILNRSELFIGLVGFLMHLARSVECRSVIVYGGREHPNQSGYACNENLYTELPCSPCWQFNRCDYNKECMRRISADDVIQAVHRQLARLQEPLIEDTAII